MFKKLIISTFFLCSLFIFSQDNENKQIKLNDSVLSLLNKSYKLRASLNYKEALDYASKAVNYAYSMNDSNSLAEALYNLANYYDILEDFKNAEENYKKALDQAKILDYNYVIVSSLNGLGNIYSDGYHDIETGLKYYEESAKYAKKSNVPKDIFISLINTGWTFLDYNKPKKAFPYLIDAREVLLKSDKISNGYLCNTEYLFGRYYATQKDYKTALDYFSRALTIAKKDTLYEELIDIHQAKFELYQKNGESNLAIQSLEESQHYKDLVFNKEKLEQIEKSKAAYKVTEYERELATANKEREYLSKLSKSNKKFILISIFSIVALIGIMVLMFYNYKNKKSNYSLKLNNESLIKAKDNAERLTKLKSEFVSTISHELRTPLYGVVGITSILLEDNTLKKKHGDLLNSLKFSGDHLINLVNNVLKIGRIESKDISLSQSPTNLYTLVQNIVNSFKFQVLEKGNTLHLNIDKELSKSYNIDALRLSEILINLISNAIKFTDKGTIQVHVILEKKENNRDTIIFEVLDSGMGVPKEKHLLIFENFKQANEEENTYEGAGLGLPIVKHLVEMMGSSIRLESDTGKGSKFTFKLDFETVAEKDDTVIIDTIKEPKKILVAEDNKISQMVTNNLIELIGHKCTIAENGLLALEKVKTEHFDLVLMDLNMPFMNGYDSASKILSQFPDTKIIALTATEISEVKDNCLEIGMVDIINKPLNKIQLYHLVNKYI